MEEIILEQVRFGFRRVVRSLWLNDGDASGHVAG
jgi:hypothetical protein